MICSAPPRLHVNQPPHPLFPTPVERGANLNPRAQRPLAPRSRVPLR